MRQSRLLRSNIGRSRNGSLTWLPRQAERWSYLDTSSIPFEDLALGDFDRDGTADVFRATNGKWCGRSRWDPVQSVDAPLEGLGFANIDGQPGDEILQLSAPH